MRMLTDKEFSDLFYLINKLVSSPEGSWVDKKTVLQSHMDESDRANLEELLSWGIGGETEDEQPT